MLGLSGARAIVLGISLLTMVVAWMLIPSAEPPRPLPIAQEAPKAPTVEVMVAANDMQIGTTLSAQDIRWMAWPGDNVPPGFIRRSPEAEKEVVGQLVQSSFLANEPIRTDKLVRREGAGFLAALLPAGKRAVAITIDRSGSSSAGGFILPNDRVDVIRIGRQEGAVAGAEAFISETILRNIRVLAVGQTVQNRGTERETVTGENATLELDPNQVETIMLAQRSGSLSLALRSVADARLPAQAETQSDRSPQGLTLVRFGVTTQSARQ